MYFLSVCVCDCHSFTNRWDAIQAELVHFGIVRSLEDVQKTAVTLKVRAARVGVRHGVVG